MKTECKKKTFNGKLVYVWGFYRWPLPLYDKAYNTLRMYRKHENKASSS